MCKIILFIVLFIIAIQEALTVPINNCPPGIECKNNVTYNENFEYKSDIEASKIEKKLKDSRFNDKNVKQVSHKFIEDGVTENDKFNDSIETYGGQQTNPGLYQPNYGQTDEQTYGQTYGQNVEQNIEQNVEQNPAAIPDTKPTYGTETTSEGVSNLGTSTDETSNPGRSTFLDSNPNENKDKNDANDKGKESNKGSKKRLTIFLFIILLVIIILIIGLLIYKRNTSSQVEEKSIEPEFKTGNLLEKIQAMKEMEEMNEMKNINQNPLLNYSVINSDLSSIQSSSRDININNALDTSSNKNIEQYNRMYNSMKRGLKPPPSRDNKALMQKNIINLNDGGSKLKITTNRKSKYSDSSKSQNTNSECFSRSSTDISQCITPTTSHSSNGIFYGYGYKNNKLNKHTSVALTFGCPSVSEKDEDSIYSPTHTSYNMSSNHSSSRLSSRISSSRISSPRSITSFLANSPITQSFKNRISNLYNRHYINDRKVYNDPEYGNNFVRLNSIIENKKPKYNTDINRDFDVSSPGDNTFMNENSTDFLIDNNQIVSSFMNDNNKKLDLTLKNYY